MFVFVCSEWTRHFCVPTKNRQINIKQTGQNWAKAEMVTVNRRSLYLQWVVSVIECDGATLV